MAAPLGRSATASAGAARRRLDQARRTARTGRTPWAGSARISRSISPTTTVGSSGSRPAGSRRLGRQRGRVGDAAVDPAAQVVVLGMAVGGDQQPALHRPAGQVEGPDARLTLDRLDGVGGQPHDQVVAPPPASHVVVHEEGEATERLLLGQPRPVADRLPDPGGEALVVRHRTIPSVADPTGWVEGYRGPGSAGRSRWVVCRCSMSMRPCWIWPGWTPTSSGSSGTQACAWPGSPRCSSRPWWPRSPALTTPSATTPWPPWS